MTTRRIVSDEKTYLDNDGKGTSEPSNIAPAVPSYVSICATSYASSSSFHRSVIWTLLSFTFAMFTLPIGTYFFTVKFVFAGRVFPLPGPTRP